jgi:hypothetical protein
LQAPGLLHELDRLGAKEWEATVATTLDDVLRDLRRVGRAPQRLTDDLAQVPDVRAPDWPGFPARIGLCVGRRAVLRLLDWRPADEGDLGRVRHQEEYLEWRLVRESASGGAIARIEMTTELREYWEVLAAQQPQTLLNLVAELAGVDEVDPEEVYGDVDLGEADEAARASAFRHTMLPGEESPSFSALNDGRQAICCMVQPTNTLSALVALAASAARPLAVRDGLTGRPRFASGAEAIEALVAAAQDGRHSDPVVVERVTSLTTEGRPVGFDDPIGVYIRGVQGHELAQPDGEDVPEEWFELSRGVSAAQAADGRQRSQRLTLAVPDDADFAVSDLVVRRTGEPLTFGGQLAALVQLTVYLRSGHPAGVSVKPTGRIDVPAPACESEHASLAEMARV